VTEARGGVLANTSSTPTEPKAARAWHWAGAVARWCNFRALVLSSEITLENADLVVGSHLIRHPSCCGTARPRVCSVSLGRGSSPYVQYASGPLGRETPQPQDLASPRYGRVTNKAG